MQGPDHNMRNCFFMQMGQTKWTDIATETDCFVLTQKLICVNFSSDFFVYCGHWKEDRWRIHLSLQDAR